MRAISYLILILTESSGADKWCWCWQVMLMLTSDADADKWCWCWQVMLMLLLYYQLVKSRRAMREELQTCHSEAYVHMYGSSQKHRDPSIFGKSIQSVLGASLKRSVCLRGTSCMDLQLNQHPMWPHSYLFLLLLCCSFPPPFSSFPFSIYF